MRRVCLSAARERSSSKAQRSTHFFRRCGRKRVVDARLDRELDIVERHGGWCAAAACRPRRGMVRVHHRILQHVVCVPMTKVEQLHQRGRLDLLDAHRRRNQRNGARIAWQRTCVSRRSHAGSAGRGRWCRWCVRAGGVGVDVEPGGPGARRNIGVRGIARGTGPTQAPSCRRQLLPSHLPSVGAFRVASAKEIWSPAWSHFVPFYPIPSHPVRSVPTLPASQPTACHV